MSDARDQGIFDHETTSSGTEWRRDWQADCNVIASRDHAPAAVPDGQPLQAKPMSAPAALRRSLFRA
jgi:hypothetical protein